MWVGVRPVGEKPSSYGRYAAIAGATIGVIAAGAAAGILAERKVVARKRSEHPEPFGSLRGDEYTVIASDALELYAEVDELPKRRRRRQPTIVFVHGYALNLDCWHFQRRAFRDTHRLVFFDQRSHGRSGRARNDHSSIDFCGEDLARVLDQLVPDGPVVLVGHSMGGMTIMALAEQHPDWFGDRITGVALIATSPGGFDAETYGLPGLPGRLMHKLAPSVVATLARAPRLVESGRRAGSDFGFVLTRRLAFGGTVPQEYVDFTDEMLAGTPFDVIAEFFPGFDSHDRAEALAALADVPTTVIGGTLDQITPIAHTRRIAHLLPTATLVEVTGAGHMILLERHDEVNQAIETLVERASRR
jgi:pimeloyl-ACP methyl ester carboxylesterase